MFLPAFLLLDITSLQFSRLDLDGFDITSPISMFPVIAVSQCVLTCLQTTGCTSVAMLNGICITFDGTVTPDAAAVYDTAYDSRGRYIGSILLFWR